MGRKGTAVLGDFSADELKKLAGQSKNAKQVRRLLALSAILEGSSREEAARIGNVGRQILHDWVVRYNAKGPDGLIDKKRPTPPHILSDSDLRKLKILVEAPPDLYFDGVVRWRLCDLKALIWDFFRKDVSVSTVSRDLKRLGFSYITSRPQHYKQKKNAVEEYKKTSQTT